MITLKLTTSKLIREEMESIPEKYQKPFNSVHEGLAVLREEYVELEQEIFFGEKQAKKDLSTNSFHHSELELETYELHRSRIRKEAVQVAAMACRIIQELT